MILNLLKKIFFLKKKFLNPPHYSIVVWDNIASNDLSNCVNLDKAFILKVRSSQVKEIYLTLSILIRILIFYRGNLVSSYFASIIDVIKPKVIITHVDNSLKFFEVSKILKKKYVFVAVQNAARYDLMRYKYLFNKKLIKKDLSKNFYLDNFFCFGQYEIDHYNENTVKIKNAQPVGSLKLSNYFHYLNKNSLQLPEKKYDISVISEGYLAMDNEYKVKELSKNLSKIMSYSIKFAKENKAKFNFIFKREKIPGNFNYEAEINFVKRYLSNDEFEFILKNCTFKNKSEFSSYDSILNCDILIGCVSSMLREKLATKGKILSCNFSGMKIFDFPIKQICYLNNPSFEEFSKKLFDLRKLSNDEFIEKLKNQNQYLINSETDANKEIKKFINHNLK